MDKYLKLPPRKSTYVTWDQLPTFKTVFDIYLRPYLFSSLLLGEMLVTATPLPLCWSPPRLIICTSHTLRLLLGPGSCRRSAVRKSMREKWWRREEQQKTNSGGAQSASCSPVGGVGGDTAVSSSFCFLTFEAVTLFVPLGNLLLLTGGTEGKSGQMRTTLKRRNSNYVGLVFFNLWFKKNIQTQKVKQRCI